MVEMTLAHSFIHSFICNVVFLCSCVTTLLEVGKFFVRERTCVLREITNWHEPDLFAKVRFELLNIVRRNWGFLRCESMTCAGASVFEAGTVSLPVKVAA